MGNMRILENPKKDQWNSLLKRPAKNLEEMEEIVKEVFSKVEKEGNRALFEFTQKFDGVAVEQIRVSEAEIRAGVDEVSPDLKDAITLAKNNIEKFHAAQRTDKVTVETAAGVLCWQEKKPILKVGLYIPGGTAPLFSTILMLAIPAKLARCEEIILCTPPDKSGNIHPAILFAAELCGVTKIFKVGGIQAIAGMTFGTESIPKVYKIFGPGNQFVTAAKQFATKNGVAIDMPAGPSELLIVADDTANPAFVASDLLSQAEHGPDSQVVLVSNSKELLIKVEEELKKQLPQLPRNEIAAQALEHARFLYIEKAEEALELINNYAPEHFIICTGNEEFYTRGIQNAGSVFIGNYSPESAGDYASGTNHTLPTNGYSKQYSGVNLDSFMKLMSFQKISEAGIQSIGPAIELMAEAEGLQAHKNAVSLRLNYLKGIL